MVEVCQNQGTPAYLVDDEGDVRQEWLSGVETVVVTAGASAPEHLVEQLVEALRNRWGFTEMEEMQIKDEDVRFSLPPELSQASRLTQIAL